ncbi:ATP-binding protein [Umezawaea beigongshangensis]|uniref:ATP-binding protein n=1 Tax=Umezawaea beigongshangensis TaxID=2780383 RepID=UPI0018F246BD|nr:ATP-binding protein [Umezawaea beigongshangensis]
MKRIRLSVRTRLTALYGGAFLVAGAVLLGVEYVLVQQALPDSDTFVVAAVRAIPPAGPTPPQPSGVAARPAVVPAEELSGGTTATEVARTLELSLDDYRSSALSTLLTQSAVALVVTAGLAVLLGWLLASRVLRPLNEITATARKLGAEDLDRRIGMSGPHDELRELADTFDGMLDRLAAAFDSQRRFVANASHELRTPLAVQRTLVEVAMADPAARPELRRLGEHLLHTNERSERMIEGLLVLARSDRGLASTGDVRLDEVVERVVRATAARAARQDVTVLSRTRERTVRGDAELLERLVVNLLHNAVDHNAPGGRVEVEIGDDPALVVRNSGPDVPADVVDSLFEPFRRHGGERTGDSRNAGLGLSIVDSIVRAHGGSVRAEPREEGGLVVSVSLGDPRRP